MMSLSIFNSLLSKLIIILVALGLIVTLGVDSDLTSFGLSDDVVAEINDQDISKEEFSYFKSMRLAQLPKNVVKDQESIGIINKQVVYMIATRKALALKAKELGLVVSEEEIKNNIINSALFQQNGKFIGFENYKRRIKEVFNLTEESFEQILREEALNDKLKIFLFNFIVISKEDISKYFMLDSTKINFYKVVALFDKSKLPDFTEEDIDNFIKINQKTGNETKTIFRIFSLNYKDITKDIFISKTDIKNYRDNYPDDSEKDKEEIVDLIKRRVANSLFDEKLVELNSQIKKTSLTDIAKIYGKNNNIKKLILLEPSGQFPRALIDELKRNNTKIGLSEVYFFEDKIWVVSSESYSNNKQNAIKKMTDISINEGKTRLLSDLLSASENSKDTISAIKVDKNYLYEFKYDISLREFQRLIGYDINVSDLANEKLFLPKIFGQNEKFVIYIEKVRKADKEFITFDETRIRKILLTKKRTLFYSEFTNDLMEKSELKLNNKYFQ